MRRTLICFLLFTLCLIGISTVAAQKGAPQHARLSLLARQESVVPGTNVQLGVHFVLEPGWHIYWVNPGDSGQPPVLKWQLPPGFVAGDIQWPRPERMQATTALADFGYHGEVLLPVTIKVPASTKVGDSVQVGADAKWLICREVCIPEHTQLQVSLPVTASARQSQSAQLFSRTDKLLSQPIPRSWKVSANSQKDDFVLSVQAGRQIAKAEFFPLDPGQIENAAPQKLRPLASGLKITLKKSDLLLKPISLLRGVLSLPDGPSYWIEAPVRQSVQ